MKKLLSHVLLCVTIIIISGCASMQPVSDADLTFSSVVEVKGFQKDQIYNGIKIWIAENFKSAKQVIEYDNKDEGTLIGNGNIQYPCNGFDCVAKGNWKVGFTMRVDVKENKFRLTFSNLRISAPANYSQYGSSPAMDAPVRMQGDLDLIKPVLLKFGTEILSSIGSNKQSNDW